MEMDESGLNFRLLYNFVLLTTLYTLANGATVTKVEPHYGSLGGETRLTIFGSGFSADQFSQNDDPNTGNNVYLVGESGSEYTCPVHKDGSTEVQIMCYTPERMVEEDYHVKVVVDGVAVPDGQLCGGSPTGSQCTYKPRADNTPTIVTMTPQSGKPGAFVTLTGKLISDRYGSNMDAATNGKAEKLLRVYVGPQDCALKDGDSFYTFALDDEESETGTLMCKSRGSSVGFFNASFIIESPYGRSKPDAYLYRVSHDDKIFLFQEYTDITSISPSTGSTEGGLTLTIYGNYFDNRAPYTAPRAYVGDTECVVTNVVVDQYIECTVAADPQSTASKYAGNRGVNFEYWTSTTSSLDDVLSLTSSSPGYVSSWLDETFYSNSSFDNYVSKMTTYFTPPHSGEYQFQLKGDDSAKLFVDGVSKASSSGSWENSDRMTLQSNTRYLLEVVHSDSSGESLVHLRAKYFDTTFTSAWTGKAVQEKQTIKITSTVKYDVQVLAFNDFTSQSYTEEVQTVEVDTPGEFRFGLFGAYTTALTTDMDESMISTAINSMPIFGSDESIMVARNPTSPPSFTLTFVSKRGDFPPISVVKVANSSSVSFTVTEDTKGVPDMDTLSLYMEGSLSSPFTLSTLSANTLGTAVDNLFSAGCPEVFSSPSLASFYESYESSSALFAGIITKESDPFCGRYTLKNPSRLYRRESDDLGIMLSSYKTLCFAYKGLLQDIIGLRYSHKQASDGERVSHWTNFAHTYQKDSETQSDSWYYTCIDMYALAYGRFPSDTEHRVEEVWVSRKNIESDIYIDSTFIGRDVTVTDTEINRLRRPASKPNGALINTATVESTGTNTYTVTLKPFECGNQLPLFGLGNGRTSSGATAYPSTASTATSNNGGSGSMSVTRSTAASPPVTGFIDVTYNGNTKSSLNVSLDAVNFKRELETISGIGSLEVEKSGNCANFDLDVTFLTLPGDLQQITVTYGSLAGINAAGSIETKVDGGLFYDPLTGDMTMTVNSQPQVRLYINDVPVACTGDCGFEWSSGATPAVTAINPATGTSALGTSATISGTGFSSTQAENFVTIGGVACNVTASTSTSITCAVGNGPVGSHKVVVTVKDKGSATHSSGDVTFEYTADVSGIAPTTGSLGGGTVLSISGYGFKSGASVTINSVACAVRAIQPGLITCTIPASSSSGTFDVVVQQGAVSLSYSGYTYDSSLTATVNSVSPSSVSVAGDTLTISGSSFSVTEGTVFLGTKQVTVSLWADTEIVVSTDAVDPGTTEVKVETSDGFALTSGGQLPTVSVDLSISNVYPLQGSTQGGTKLTITGSGFGTNDTLVDVSVGDVSCDIDSLSNTQIICQIAKAGQVHQVTNKGTDPAYGIYYAFDQPRISIKRGDFVRWTWETPAFVNDVNHAIIEVDSPSSTEAKVGGFTSGTPSANGQYQYQFMKTGTYYVWSGYVDTYGIKNYVGTIEVVNEVSSVGEVKVNVLGKDALHNVGGSSDPSDPSACQSIITGKAGCSDARPSGGNAGKFNFAFWTCATPVINSIDRTNGTAKTDITLSGNGLSSTNCQNEISFGGYRCTATSSSDSSVVCRLDKSTTPELGVLHAAAVRVGNRGYSILNVDSQSDRSLAVIPNIEDIQPTAGSVAGGTRVTIDGFGFGDAPEVTIGGYTCTIISNTYTQIVCETPSVPVQGEKDIAVNAYVGGSPLPAECETSLKTCKFTYAMLWTPTVSDISPTEVNSSTTFNITGTKFGTVAADVSVTVGGYPATLIAAGDSYVQASVTNAPAGTSNVVVTVQGYGKASGSLTVTGTPLITSVSPATGSIHGEQLITIQGNGFVDGQTTVTLDGASCNITAVTLAEIICRTQAHATSSVDLVVTSNSVSYTAETFEYATGSTPTVSSLNPTFGLAGSTLTISGSNLGGSAISVLLDDAPCSVTFNSSSEVRCTLGNHATGSVPVSVHVAEYGASNTDVEFEYQLSLSSINPTQGGTAGGQRLTLTGSGFTSDATVTVCSEPCPVINSSTTELVCKTPSASAQTCNVEVTVNSLTKSLSSAYTYNAGLTPSLTGVTPTRGGTGGGTTITITGSGFGSVVGDVEARIDGAACAVQTASPSQITCITGPHQGSITSSVEVEISGNGIAQESSTGVADFSYIDVWSSTFTWGGGPLPQEGEFIIIPAGMSLLLDTDTPRLDFLLIQGGELIFDNKDIELKANIIMITNGGKLQVGTEAEPFQHKGIITLYGHHRSKELPIYGTKVLAVRNGTLDLHGIEVPLTWTRLASTANSGSSTIELVDPIEWNVGDEVVIAATGHHHSQSENEKKTITAISGDKMTLTLDSALSATHVGTEETFDGTLVEFRAEVGLLTHNVVVRGNTNPQWEDEIEACEAGFNTGEFATQTCFLGRFGDEIGSSQFGGMILVHSPVKDTHEAEAKLSYIEVTFGGQAFRLGRYPIHFHLNGDMSTSYVRGCGIHQTFNRAVNIHGTHNTIVEKTVIYNIMGGAFFLEDGIETGNTFQYNLAVFVRESSSLLNDDVTPASFWLTNPNNTVQHNAAAGGSHFGYWYRMHDHPEGPSYTTDVCCKNTPLGVFNNNSAHSFGWFGLWIFPDYFPLQGGCGGAQVEPAVFRGLFAWNNDKGAETVNTGALQFEGFTLVQNKFAGFEGKKVLDVPLYTDASPMVNDTLIVGKTTVIPDGTQGCTKGGVIFPYGGGFRLKNVRFVNFADSECAALRWTRIDGTCGDQCGGYNYHSEQISYTNVPNKAVYAWDWEGMIVDLDGSLTGKGVAGWTVAATTGSLPNDCESATDFSKGIPASMCPPGYKFHRFAFNNILPESLGGKNFLITNEYGTSSVVFRKKRLSHKPGWMCALVGGATYSFEFENAAQIKNISFTGQFDDFGASDYIFMKLSVERVPDRFSIDGGNNFINATVGGIDPSTAQNGDWEWNNTNKEIKFLVHGNKRSRRGMSTYTVDRPFNFQLYKCFYTDCIPPPDPNTIPPATERPLQYQTWDDTSIWNATDDGYVSNIGGAYGVPQDYDDVKIGFGEWVVVSSSINKLGTLLLEGVLEFQDSPTANYEINADFIIIRGGRLIIGWPNDPFDGLANIILRGNHSTAYFNAGDGPQIGSKAIGVFGGLDLFGKDVGVAWTQLAATANAGANQIVLKDQVTWSVGDDIVIGPTTYNVWQTESFRISAIAADNVTLTLNETLKYKHIAHTESLSNGFSIDLAATVGLLTRNIQIIGEDYPDLYTESFGARILVGLVTYKGSTFGGYARLSNVEFYHTGQEGWTEEYDPRFSVAYVATGTVSEVKPSFVSKCSFHNGFNTAVGAFGIGSLNISDNVVFGSVGNGLSTSSNDTRLVNNLVTLMISTATYLDRLEPFNLRWEAGIEAMAATNLVLQDNMVTGSERMAYHVAPQDCTDTTDNYRNNRAFANVIGVVVVPDDVLTQTDCAKMSGFISWKNHDYGIYYQNNPSVKITDNVVIENVNNIITFVLGPSALGHEFANKLVEIANSTIIGKTSTYDCSADVLPALDPNTGFSGSARPSVTPSGGMAGVIFPNFYQKSNKATFKPWKGCMAYNAIGGLMKLTDNTFANFKSTGCNGGEYAVSTNNGNDDLQHPVEAERNTLINVDSSNKIVYHRPNVGKINSADCIDMDCDALKKALFKDLDGTFLGHVGSVIPHSEFEWGGDPRRGLGDYRIPKEMVTDMNGNRIAYDTLMPNKGVIRNTNCTYQSTWQAYECQDDINYEMLVIESMDADTEVRRLSPVGILGDGYIDLINGPQDHGWCSGYTCRKRLSTFHAIVATDKEYLMHFTSVTPKHMRYRLLNVDASKAVKYSVWYSRPNRLDVFVDDQYVQASNAEIDANGRYKLKMPTGNEYEPQLANATGTNYFDKDTGVLTFIIKGSQKIDVVTKDTIIVSFSIPGLTVDDFFGDNLVENMASFLNIPLNKVRIVNVVSASAGAGRKKRSAGGVTVQMEIGDEPTSNINDTASNSINYDSLLNLAGDIVNECQAGNVSSTLNISGGCNEVQVPSTDSETAGITYTTLTPHQLVFINEPVPNYEGVVLLTQPKIRAKDISDVIISALGTAEHPWQLEASIRPGTGSPSATLNGTLTVNATNGWFNFTDLSISLMGTGFILDFNVTSPAVATNFSVSSSPFDLAGRPLKVGVPSQTSGDIVRDARFSITLDLRDQNTNEIIPDIAWRGHTWTAQASFLGSQDYGSLNGVVFSTFDPTSGQAMFPDLNITGFGIFYIQFRVVSNPADFNLTLNHKLVIKNPAHIGMTIEDTNEIEVKFDVDYNKVLPSEDKQNEFEQMVLTRYANIWPDVQLQVGSIREGSIVVTFTISGSTTDVNSTAYSLCESIDNSTSYTFNGYVLSLSQFMTINNQTFYGASCGTVDSNTDDDDDELKPYIIALIVVFSVLILIMVAILLVWRFCFKSKSQSHTPPRMVQTQPFVVDEKSGHANGAFYVGNTNPPPDDLLYKDRSFTSLQFRTAPVAAAAPNTTQAPTPSYNDYFKKPLRGPIISARSPRTANPQQPAPISVSNLEAELSHSNTNTLLVAQHGGRRQLTPPTPGNATPRLSRPLSPFRDTESPMPPVGEGYTTDI